MHYHFKYNKDPYITFLRFQIQFRNVTSKFRFKTALNNILVLYQPGKVEEQCKSNSLPANSNVKQAICCLAEGARYSSDH